MLFSFANLAVSLWLGLIALACLRWAWRIATDRGNGHPGRDYSRAHNSSESYRNHQPKDRRSRDSFSAGSRSVASIFRKLVNIFRAAFDRIIHSFLELPWSAAAPPSPTPPSPALPQIPEVRPISSEVDPKSDAPKEARLRRSRGAGGQQRTAQSSTRASEIQSASQPPKPRKLRPKSLETDAATGTGRVKRLSEKPSGTASRARVNAAKKTARTKAKIAVASNAGVVPKIGV
jgi:hypothetical protein